MSTRPGDRFIASTERWTPSWTTAVSRGSSIRQRCASSELLGLHKTDHHCDGELTPAAVGLVRRELRSRGLFGAQDEISHDTNRTR